MWIKWMWLLTHIYNQIPNFIAEEKGAIALIKYYVMCEETDTQKAGIHKSV